MMSPPTLDAIQAARVRGADLVLTTPLMETTSLTHQVGRRVILKAENLQRAGSFKVRGALSALSLLTEAQRGRGVVAASAGNHAQGVALAASHLGIAATVFMPVGASIPKVAATRAYGAAIRLEGADLGEAVDEATAFATETGARFIHPYDDPAIIAGQGTLGLELVEQLNEPAATFVIPVGGGGLIAGTALAIKSHHPDSRVVGVQSSAVPAYLESRRAGAPTTVPVQTTVADGIAVGRPSAIAFSLIEQHVDDIVAVDDPPVTEAVALLLERAKLLVEPSGAVGMAAILEGKVPGAGPVVAVLSGGNIDLLLLDSLVRYGQESRGRFAAFNVHVPDQPGQLARVLTMIGDSGANVLSVEHHREGAGLPYGVVGIQISIATRSHEHQEQLRETLEAQGIALVPNPGSPSLQS